MRNYSTRVKRACSLERFGKDMMEIKINPEFRSL
jgi:hypothetical protein